MVDVDTIVLTIFFILAYCLIGYLIYKRTMKDEELEGTMLENVEVWDYRDFCILLGIGWLPILIICFFVIGSFYVYAFLKGDEYGNDF